MSRGTGAAGSAARGTAIPRTVVQTHYVCSACGSHSTFDGNGGEWCPTCETARYLAPQERLYRLVEIALDS